MTQHGGTSQAVERPFDGEPVPLWVDSRGALVVNCVAGCTDSPVITPSPEPGVWLGAVILLAWALMCWRLRAFGELRHDFQHPSEIAPNGCYDDGDDE